MIMDMENSVVLRKLHSFSTFPIDSPAGANVSVSDLLNNQSEHAQREKQRAAFKVLIEEEASEVIKYNALRAVLEQSLTPPITVDKVTIIALVREALNLVKILTKKYDLYINEQAGFLNKRILQQHQHLYEEWLKPPSPENKRVDTLQKITPTWFDASLAWFYAEFTTERMNPRRLYVLRERRLLVLLVPIIKDFGNYCSWVTWADAYVAPFLLYINVVFFLPRLIFNLNTLYSNVFDENKMKTEAINLSRFTRFMAQWKRLWPQLMNDIGWTINGIMMCFVFFGSWQPLAIYLSVAMQFYDALMVSIRMYIDFNRLNKLLAQYNSLAFEPNFILDEKYKKLHYAYCMQLEKGIQREKTLLYLAFANAAVLFLATCLSLPFMVAFSPLFPIIGAAVAILMTVINFQGRSYLNTPESSALEELLKGGQPACSESSPRLSSTDLLQPETVLTLNHEPRQPVQEPSSSLFQVGQSSNNPTRFFSSKALERSQSSIEFKPLQGSPSPTGIVLLSLSPDALDADRLGMGLRRHSL